MKPGGESPFTLRRPNGRVRYLTAQCSMWIFLRIDVLSLHTHPVAYNTAPSKGAGEHPREQEGGHGSPFASMVVSHPQPCKGVIFERVCLIRCPAFPWCHCHPERSGDGGLGCFGGSVGEHLMRREDLAAWDDQAAVLEPVATSDRVG